MKSKIVGTAMAGETFVDGKLVERSITPATLARELRQAIEGAVVHTATMNDALINTGVNNALTAFDEVCGRYGIEVNK